MTFTSHSANSMAHCSTPGSARSASERSNWTPLAVTSSVRRSPWSSTGRSVFAKGVNWIPDDPFPARITPAAVRRPSARSGRARRRPAPGVGRWDLRVRSLLRGLRPARRDGVAGLRLRVRGVPRGGAVRDRGRRRSDRSCDQADASPEPGAVVWQQRERCGGTPIGIGPSRPKGAPGDAGFYLDVLPEIVGRIDPTRPYWAGSPWSQAGPRLETRSTSIRTTPTTAAPMSGRSGTGSTSITIAIRCRGSSRSSAGRLRPPGQPCARL